ncbi:RNA polymerase II transcription factor SIII subunit A-domain-containing protein [Pilobolus umbonatus]|nr:RNA polymerase II transcription factor SIII subunit A-domain-containing protein [Pilobolus umbonatus]
MLHQVKSLVTLSQDTLSKYLDVLTEIGGVPYSLLKNSLVRASPQQLYRIEKLNPHLMPESNELWLSHCLTFRDIREEYDMGMHRDSTEWRRLYVTRYKENERKRQLIKQKIKGQYNKEQHERQAKSIKILKGVVSTKERTYDAARKATMSKLFQQTKKEASKISSIYRSNTPAHRSTHRSTHTANVIDIPKPPSQLIRAYQSTRNRYSGDIPPPTPSPPSIAPVSQMTEKINKKRKYDDVSGQMKPEKKSVAEVKYNPFTVRLVDIGGYKKK